MKIISIVPYKVLPARLGGEKGIALFNQYLGKEADLIAIGVKSNEVSQAKNYFFLPLLSDHRIRYGNPMLYFKLRKLIQTHRPSHIIIEHPYFAWLAFLLKKTFNIKWVIHSHNIEFQRSKSIGRWWWRALQWYELWAYRQADSVFFISEVDRHIAVNEYGIASNKSFSITYGIEIDRLPTDIQEARTAIKSTWGIKESTKILLFNGALYHHSNYNALSVILDRVNPILLDSPLDYKIIVCGKGLPDFFDELKAYKQKNVIYAGFVEDISLYFKASDIFLNPILTGGGVKTKAIEAIAYNCTVVSTKNGAQGIPLENCGNKLVLVKDSQWDEFAIAIISNVDRADRTPNSFYEYYYWGNIVKKVVKILKES